ncbi:hypothetical protein JCM19298_1888 [Nonlabens ulvanivorans]|nr:hypothetical protein [Nonlabens ulvanivorans]GAK93169.1 hypothetical protein JCM19298_1888 [Nonlabens ulvanivorans]
MKKFTSYLLVSVLLVFSIALVLDIIFSKTSQLIESDLSDEQSVWNDIYKSKIETDVAIYGSSRAWVHVDPTVIDSILHVSSYNLGIDGYSFHMQHYRHQEYLKYNKKPKQIILIVDWMSFKLEKEGLYNSNQFRPYMLWNRNSIEYLGDNEATSLLDFYIPFYRYAGRINPFRSFIEENSPIIEREKGFKSFSKEWKSQYVKPFHQKFDIETLNLFEEFLIDMKSENINVTLVVAPFYIVGQDIVLNKDENMSIISKIADEQSVLLIDYSKSYISYQKEYFYNNSHLNAKGARIFSLKLANDLKSSKTPTLKD